MVRFDEEKQNKRVDELRRKEEEELAQILSSKYGVQYIDLGPISISTDALRLIEEAKAREAKIASFHIVGKKLSVAVLSPNNELSQQIIDELTERGYIITVYMVSTQSLEKAWNSYKDLSYATESTAGSLDISNEDLKEFTKKLKTLDDVRKTIKENLSQKITYRVSKIIEIIMAGALATDASDIHIEPEETYVRLRYRLDGVLVNISEFDTQTYNLLLSRMKLLSGLKLNVKNDAQDGRFSVKLEDTSIEIRTSMLPGSYGESIVLRILNPKSIAVKMEDLGIESKLLKIIQNEIEKPNGMLLITGPTGSGKTTTLYAFLQKIHTPEVKIITIEDPIEYHLPGVTQTQVNEEKGYTFLNGLRSALRQDPDVIMVGEIRDKETAEIAINSALTGHLVFSTLHTNNAAGSFPRLIDLGVNPKIITSAVNLVMAQRLVRKLCVFCKKQVVIEGEDKILVDEILTTIKDKSAITNTEKMWVAVGCDKCNGTGYKGRLGIFEAVVTDENIEKVVRENPSEREIVSASESQGILNMQQDGLFKVLNGITSLEEVKRVVYLEEQ